MSPGQQSEQAEAILFENPLSPLFTDHSPYVFLFFSLFNEWTKHLSDFYHHAFQSTLNSLTNDALLDQSIMNDYVDDKINVSQKLNFFFFFFLRGGGE